MNDLAERALLGLDVARRALIARPLPWLAALGFVAAAAMVFTGGRIGAAPAAVPIDGWLGLLPPAGYVVDGPLLGLAMLAGLTVLALTWLTVVRVVDHRQVSLGAVWAVGACWGVPFVVGPPLLGTDVFSAVARGELARADLSPYHHGPAALTDQRLVNAIDPTARSAHSTGGPLASALEHLCATATADNTLATVLLLRAIAVVAVVAIGRLAIDLAAPRRAPALVITALNPAVLLFVVSGARFEGLALALTLAALLRAAQRRWLLAILFAGLAAGLRPILLIVVVAVVVGHAVGHPGRPRRQPSGRIALRDGAVAVLVLAAVTCAVPYGLGWAGNLLSLTRAHTAFAPSSVVSNLISLVITAAPFDDLAAGGRVAALLAALTAVVYVLITVRDRPLERTVGFALLAVGVLGPVVYPWYLLWGVVCLAPTARRGLRDWVVALSFVACVLDPVGFTDRGAELVTGAALLVIAAWLTPRLVIRHRRAAAALRAAEPEDVSADA